MVLGYEGARQAQPPFNVQYDTSGPTTERLNALVSPFERTFESMSLTWVVELLWIDTFCYLFSLKDDFNSLNTFITRAYLEYYTFVPQLESQLADTFNRDTLKYLCTQQVDKNLYLTLDMLMVVVVSANQQHHIRNATDASLVPILWNNPGISTNITHHLMK